MTDWSRTVGVALQDVRFNTTQNVLEVGGRVVLDLLKASPAYVYDGPSVAMRLSRLRRLLDDRIRIRYAVKANPFPNLLRYLVPLVDGFDVASSAEIAAVLAAGATPGSLSLAGPGKSAALLEDAATNQVVISVESETELHRLAATARQLGSRPPILLRINPTFTLRGSGMHMAGQGSPFGIDSENARAVLADLPDELDFRGFHVFCASQCLSTEALIEAHGKIGDLISSLAASADRTVSTVCIGAGFGIPYFPGDEPFNLGAVAECLNAVALRLSREHADVNIQLEMGRFLVGEAGIYLCTVTDKKYSRGEVFLITNGGMHHHLAASGNLGQVLKRNYPVCIANRLEADEHERVTVTGPLCTPLDVLARGVLLPKAEVGDTVAIFQSGAYGLSASPTGFLGHPLPAEILLES